MYDWRNTPLPSHERWKTKPARIVYSLRNTGPGDSIVSFVAAMLFGYTAHFFVTEKMAVQVGICAYFVAYISIQLLLRYYGFIIKGYPYPVWQKLLTAVILLIIVFTLIRSFI